ncbi:TniQ family protein [Roseovarius sp. E0-M6]|uniref:TniQ family protein n=1 Tax=Roseovarius sp. E0-M6 TaxID=3127118 RepID=UPI00300FD4CB
MVMLPVLPLIEGESTVSWCSRLGPFHAGLSGPDFLKLMQISRQSVVDTTDDCIGRLADLTGIAADRIRTSGVQRVGEARFKHRDEVFGMRFALRTHTSFCPACLLEDADPAGHSSGQRVGRIGWMFSPVRTCPRHGLVLHRRPNSGFHEQFQDMTLVAPDDAALEKLAGNAPSANTFGLQSYVERRFDGVSGPDWLDTQDVDQATKACEMLGACLVFGAHTNLDRLSLGDWSEAGSAGFEAARDGVDGLRKALEEISRVSFRQISKGGPQAALSRMYQWLQFKKSKTDPGPIRDVVREFVLDTMPVDPGSTLFGTPVDTRRRHSLASLSRSTGVHQATLRRALKLTDVLLADVDADDQFTVDAGQGEKLADRICNSIPISKIPEYLNCNRTQAQMLVKRGTVSQLVPGLGRGGGVLTKVAVRDLDDFISRFRAHGTPVCQASDGMVDVINASEIVRRPVMDIVQLVLDRKLTSLELLSEDLGFRSVLVSPDEVRAVISELEGEIGLSTHDVAARLGIFTSGVTHPRTKVDRSGRPFLPSLETVASSGTVRHRFAEEELKRFQADYVALADLARARGKAPKVVAMELRKLDIKPIMRRELLNAAIYRRADL